MITPDDTILAIGDTIRFDWPTFYATYLWQVGDIGQIIAIDRFWITAQKDWPAGPIEVFSIENITLLPRQDDQPCESQPSHPDISPTSLSSGLPQLPESQTALEAEF
jgi:hypothetical protein